VPRAPRDGQVAKESVMSTRTTEAGGAGVVTDPGGDAVAAALLALLVGAMIGGRLAGRMGTGASHRWTGAAFGIEALLLVAAMGVSIGHQDGVRIPVATVYVVIGSTGVAMGVRNATVRSSACQT